jgi:hypothetical protein
MTSLRRTSAIAGVMFLITHVTSVAALVFYKPALGDENFIAGAGSQGSVLVGVLLEVILVLAIVGTAIAVFPAVRRISEAGALAYVALRTLEAGVIAVGVIPLLVMVSLRQDLADPASAATLGHALVSFHNWTFLVGPSFVCGTNTAVLAFLLHRSGLVPRFIPVLGLVGGPLVFLAGAAVLLGALDQFSASTALFAVPVFAWEICLAVFMLVRGFREPVEAVVTASSTTPRVAALV